MELEIRAQDVPIQPRSDDENLLTRLECVRWRSILSVVITSTEADCSKITIWPETNLEFCNNAPHIEDGRVRAFFKPQGLGKARFRLVVVLEPRDYNYESTYEFDIIEPFAFPNRDIIDASFALVPREADVNQLQKFIAMSLFQRKAATTAGNRFQPGIWLQGPLCVGKTTIIDMLCNQIDRAPYVVLRDTRLLHDPSSPTNLETGLSQGELLSIGVQPSMPTENQQSFLYIHSNGLSGWVRAEDVAKLSTVRIDSRLLVNVRNENELYRKVNEQLLKQLGQERPTGAISAGDIIESIRNRTDQIHVVIILDEFDRFMSMNSLGINLLNHLIAVVQEQVDYKKTYGLVLLVVDHLPPDSYSISPDMWHRHQAKEFSEPELSNYMKTIFTDPNTDVFTQALSDYTQGHPLLINLFLRLYLKKYGNSRQSTQVSSEELTDMAYQDDHTKMVLKWLVSQCRLDHHNPPRPCPRLNNQEREVMIALIRDRPIPPRLSSAIRSLQAKGLIDDTDHGFKVKVLALRQLLRHYQHLLEM